MRLHQVIVLDCATLTVLFTFSPFISAIDDFESALHSQLCQSHIPNLDTPCTSICAEHPVAVQRKGDLLYVVVTGVNEDELVLVSLLSNVYRVITAACEEEPPTAPRLTAYYGKVVVCLHEAFGGQGFQLQRSIENILRNSKLKAPLL